MRSAYLALVLLVTVLLASAPPVAAQGRFEIKYRVLGGLKPGSDAIFQFMLARVEPTGDLKPVKDAVFEVSFNGGKTILVKADENGIASASYKISSFSIFGSTIRIDVRARSQLYGVEATRTIVVRAPADFTALACLLTASLSILVPLLMLVKRVRG